MDDKKDGTTANASKQSGGANAASVDCIVERTILTQIFESSSVCNRSSNQKSAAAAAAAVSRFALRIASIVWCCFRPLLNFVVVVVLCSSLVETEIARRPDHGRQMSGNARMIDRMFVAVELSSWFTTLCFGVFVIGYHSRLACAQSVAPRGTASHSPLLLLPCRSTLTFCPLRRCNWRIEGAKGVQQEAQTSMQNTSFSEQTNETLFTHCVSGNQTQNEKIMREIVSTESTYCSHLKTLVNLYHVRNTQICNRSTIF